MFKDVKLILAKTKQWSQYQCQTNLKAQQAWIVSKKAIHMNKGCILNE